MGWRGQRLVLCHSGFSFGYRGFAAGAVRRLVMANGAENLMRISQSRHLQDGQGGQGAWGRPSAGCLGPESCRIPI
jgi:hypothetical protein